MLVEIPSPQFADFLKSATGQLPKLPTCACRNFCPPKFADFPKSATGQLPMLPTCSCRIPPPVCRFCEYLPQDSYLHVLAESLPICRFSKICHWTDPYMCLQKFPPSLQIFQNLPLNSYLIYLHVLAEFPPLQFADYLKICHWSFT